MSERLTDQQLQILWEQWQPAAIEIQTLRALVTKLEAALEAQRDHWRWIVKAYPDSGASATAGYALAAIDDAGG